MSAVQLYIDGRRIILPEDFSTKFEKESPVADLDTIITGGYAFDVRFAYGENKIAMQHANRVDVADRVIVYDAHIEYNGETRFRGQFFLQTSETDAQNNGYYQGSLVDNVLAELLDKQLSELLTKVIDLGANTAEIIAAAAAQNVASMSTDGATGAVMKFVPHHNPEFYGNKNPDWKRDADFYDPESEYNVGSNVLWQPTGDVYRPKIYTPDTNRAPGQSPGTHPADWVYRAVGILNHWNKADAEFYKNAITFITTKPIININALVPWLQTHDVIRELCASVGYTARGDYMDDTHERLSLIYSNLALDRRILQRCIAFISTFSVAAGQFLKVTANAKLPVVDYDPLGLWSDVENAFQTSDEGFISYRITGMCAPGGTAIGVTRLYFQIEDEVLTTESANAFFPSGASDAFQQWTAADFAGGPLPFDITIDHYNELSGFLFNLSVWNYWTTDGGSFAPAGTITDVNIEVIHRTREGLNDYSGEVRYADHVPDMSGLQFLLSQRMYKCLHITFDALRREVYFNYDKRIIEGKYGAPVYERSQIAGYGVRTEPRKRFEMQYANLPELTAQISVDFDILPPVATANDLPSPPQFLLVNGKFGKACLVQNENAFYLTEKAYDGIRTEWRLAGHNYPTLMLNDAGDKTEINIPVGPVPMGRFWDSEEDEIYNPVTSGEGRSSAFNLRGTRPPLLLAYWLGIDVSLHAAGYPCATTTKMNAAGTAVLARDMSVQTLFQENWKRTLQMLVLEEVIKVYYRWRPDLRNSIDFSRLLLIENTPTLPLRISESIGGQQIVEVEARKVKQDVITIVSGASEAVVTDPEDINDYYQPYGLNGTIETVADDIYIILISAPYNAILQAVGGALNAGTCTIKVRVNGVAITPASAITTTYSEVVHPEETLILLGDTVELEITDATAGEVLNFVVKLLLIP